MRAGGEGVTEDKMVVWHHGFNGHESERIPGDREGQGSLVCCSPWGRKESDMTKRLNNNANTFLFPRSSCLISLETSITDLSDMAFIL